MMPAGDVAGPRAGSAGAVRRAGRVAPGGDVQGDHRRDHVRDPVRGRERLPGAPSGPDHLDLDPGGGDDRRVVPSAAGRRGPERDPGGEPLADGGLRVQFGGEWRDLHVAGAVPVGVRHQPAPDHAAGLSGGLLGVLFMIPLRPYLIVREHHTLPYPEGTACAEVLKAAESGGARAKNVFLGLGIGALFKGLTGWVRAVPDELDVRIPFLKKGQLGSDVSAALFGVGYILGPRIATIMVGGGLLSWLVDHSGHRLVG